MNGVTADGNQVSDQRWERRRFEWGYWRRHAEEFWVLETLKPWITLREPLIYGDEMFEASVRKDDTQLGDVRPDPLQTALLIPLCHYTLLIFKQSHRTSMRDETLRSMETCQHPLYDPPSHYWKSVGRFGEFIGFPYSTVMLPTPSVLP